MRKSISDYEFGRDIIEMLGRNVIIGSDVTGILKGMYLLQVHQLVWPYITVIDTSGVDNLINLFYISFNFANIICDKYNVSFSNFQEFWMKLH